ncbi:aldo-keto reductase, putative [Paecilomyces variotii No. 5]|uniref:Aldo-keto reductase, putative n=1 Tax=Byssochlamys spectabilis (strain No. 5 / NBRC 109023) TaxID=1356009 RepID=V5I656_BYSSN|nr:aldo-keto reductase, putative [Paecilomyces variotii No. 5]
MSVQPIPLRQLGKDGPSVPALGYGLMGLAGLYGKPPSDEERLKILDRAFELGARFWDTADIYLDNLELIAKWFKRTGKRSEVFLASKFGIVMDMEKFQFKGINSSAEYCKQKCEESLQRLGIDYIDLYYAHRANPATPIEETMRAMAELQAEGKIKHIGLCEVNSNTLRRACKVAHVAAVQVEYSPFLLDVETEASGNLLQTCRELGVAIVCSSPLGRGMLTGAFMTKESLSGEGDMRVQMFPRFQEENFDTNTKLVAQFKTFADKKGCTPSQLALAWLLKQGDNVIPIPGTKKIKYLEQNWDALKVQLSDGEEAEIRRFLESADVKGYKSPEEAKQIDRLDTKEDV